MEYNFSEIEKKWQKAWEENGVYTVSNESDKPPMCWICSLILRERVCMSVTR